jgi:hypothetical protein
VYDSQHLPHPELVAASANVKYLIDKWGDFLLHLRFIHTPDFKGDDAIGAGITGKLA